jgi:hypothetical protein
VNVHVPQAGQQKTPVSVDPSSRARRVLSANPAYAAVANCHSDWLTYALAFDIHDPGVVNDEIKFRPVAKCLARNHKHGQK